MFATLLQAIFIPCVIAENAIPNPSFPINAPGRIMSPDENVNRYRWIQRRARKRACTLSNPISALIINPGSILTWQGLKNVATNVDRVDLIIAYMIMATVYLSYVLITHIMNNVMHKNCDQKKEPDNISLQKYDIKPKNNNQVKEHKQAHVHTILDKCHKKDKKLLKKLLKRARSMSRRHRAALLHAIIAYAKARKLNPNLRLKYCLKDILKHMGIPLHAVNHKDERDDRNVFHEKCRKTIHIHLHHCRCHPKFHKSRHLEDYNTSKLSKKRKGLENTTNTEPVKSEINEKPIYLQYNMTDELKQRIGAVMKKLKMSSPRIATVSGVMTT